MEALAERPAGAAEASISAGDAPVQDAVRAQQEKFRWATLLVVLTGTFMTTLDFFIVNVAIPSTQKSLHAGPAAVQWIVAGFGLATAAGVITAGRLGDLHGRRKMYALGLGLFTAASAACGLAPTAGVLIAARIAQGAAGALMGPQVLAIIGTAYEGAARMRAFIAYGLTMGLAAVFGQLIGGVLIQADIAGLGWRSCFLINIPIGAAALALVPRTVPESRAEKGSRLDVTGMALVTAALVATVLPLIQGQSQGWPLWTWLSLAAAVVLFGVFGFHQGHVAARSHAHTAAGHDETVKAPLVDPAMFQSRPFTVSIIAQTVFWMGQGSFFLVFALYLQAGRGMSALDSGLVFTAIGAGYLVASMKAGDVMARVGRQTPALGGVVMAVALIALIAEVSRIGSAGEVGWLLPALALDGVGMGLVIGPMANTSMMAVEPEHAGAASGVVSTVMQVGGAVGVAVIGIVFYDALGRVPNPAAYAHAFERSLEVLVAVALSSAALLQLMPQTNAAAAVAAGGSADGKD
jgi:EmrB/QacA subfamily drug resistance transporter